jgi:hypothetical protein
VTISKNITSRGKNMKKLLFSIILGYSISCTSLFGSPSINFVKSEHDFGTVKQETVVKEFIIFKNNGNSVLIIKKVQTSCGCTGTKVNNDKISPGEEGILEISFNSGRYNGHITKTIYIYTNIPDKETVIFKIRANVIK